MRENDRRGEQEPAENIVEGRNAVIEALRAGRKIDKVFILKDTTDPTLRHIAAKARAAGAVVADADRRKLDQMSRTAAHQGVIAQVAVHEYASLEDIFAAAADRGEPPLIVICDELSDPHNLGAIIRTADASGAHGVIIPKRRSVGLTPTVAKTSAGALEHVPVVRVANIPAVIRELKDRGVWVYGAAAGGDCEMYGADLKGSSAIVIGNEGVGIGRLVAETCDRIISIPMKGKISSLNASASAAVLLYEALRQRRTD